MIESREFPNNGASLRLGVKQPTQGGARKTCLLSRPWQACGKHDHTVCQLHIIIYGGGSEVPSMPSKNLPLHENLSTTGTESRKCRIKQH